jgi:hypothetical protein
MSAIGLEDLKRYVHDKTQVRASPCLKPGPLLALSIRLWEEHSGEREPEWKKDPYLRELAARREADAKKAALKFRETQPEFYDGQWVWRQELPPATARVPDAPKESAPMEDRLRDAYLLSFDDLTLEKGLAAAAAADASLSNSGWGTPSYCNPLPWRFFY